MIKITFRFLGRLIFVITLLHAAFVRFNQIDMIKNIYLKKYQYCKVSLRDFNIFLPSTSQVDDFAEQFIYFTLIYEILIAILLIIGKKIAGYLLLLYYLVIVIVLYLIQISGRGKYSENIHFQYQIARYVALVGISILFTYVGYQSKKPF